MTNEQKKQLVIEILLAKQQEFGSNQQALLEFLAEAALMTTEQINAQILAYAQAKKAKLEADKAALESQKISAEEQLTQASNEIDGVISALEE